MPNLMLSFEGIRQGDKLRVVNTYSEANSRMYHDFSWP